MKETSGTRCANPTRWLVSSVAIAAVVALGGRCPAAAQVTYGTLSNFDVFNDTGEECHGFEIELEGCSSSDILYTFGEPYERYGNPSVVDFPGGVYIRYESPYDPINQVFTQATPMAPSVISPTDGHACWNGGSADYLTSGCEHFGLEVNGNPTATRYRWLVADPINTGALQPSGTKVSIPAPIWNVSPPPPNAPDQVNPVVAAAIQPPPPQQYEFGDALWVKVFKTESPEPAELDHLLTDDPAVPQEQAETEVEWMLLQASQEADGELQNEAQVGDGNESVTRRYEFYAYTGAYDHETHEAMPIDDSDPVASDIGNYIGAQMAAINLVAVVIPTPTPTPSTTTCSSLNMVWRDANNAVIQSEPYTCGADDCLGFRCIVGDEISSECYDEAQCSALCTGLCIDIQTAQLDCETLCSLGTTLPTETPTDTPGTRRPIPRCQRRRPPTRRFRRIRRPIPRCRRIRRRTPRCPIPRRTLRWTRRPIPRCPLTQPRTPLSRRIPQRTRRYLTRPTNTPVPADTPTNTPVPADTPTNPPAPTNTPSLAQSADLVLVVRQVPRSARAGRRVGVRVTVRNLGPAVATGTILSLTLTGVQPEDVATLRIPLSCSVSGTSVSCPLGDLKRRRALRRIVSLKPSTTGPIGIAISASTTAPLLNPANAIASLTVAVQ